MDSVTTSGFAILGLHVGETEKKKKKKEKRTNLKDSLGRNIDSLLVCSLFQSLSGSREVSCFTFTTPEPFVHTVNSRFESWLYWALLCAEDRFIIADYGHGGRFMGFKTKQVNQIENDSRHSTNEIETRGIKTGWGKTYYKNNEYSKEYCVLAYISVCACAFFFYACFPR